MKKIAWIWILLFIVSLPNAALAVVSQHDSQPGVTDGDVRLCLELMELDGTDGDADESMELPPMKSEQMQEPARGPGLQLKTSPGNDPGLAAPEPAGGPRLSPLILPRPASVDDPEKLPLKPLATDREEEQREDGATMGKLQGELKPLSPVDAPGGGLKMTTSGSRDAPAPFAAPEIPLLAEDQKGPGAIGQEASPAALSLKPARVTSPAPAGGEADLFALGSMNAAEQPFGSELDEKLNAIYEKFYKNRE
jgi:hypothetical protein